MLGSAAPAYFVEHQGKRFEIRKLNRDAAARYSRDVIQYVRKTIEAVYSDDPDCLRAELRQLRDDAVSGYYGFGEEFIQGKEVYRLETRQVNGKEVAGYVLDREGGFIRTADGVAMLLLILFDATERELDEAYRAKKDEFDHLLSLTFAESLRQAKDAWKPGDPPKNLYRARG